MEKPINNLHLKRRKQRSFKTHKMPEDEEMDEEDVILDTCVLLNSGQISKTEVSIEQKEPVWVTAVQMFVPFIVAGFGMVAASLLLDKVQHWPVYKDVSEVYILVPALLGLKGNLEMTLASRLSTHANLGHLDTHHQKIALIGGNLALILCQAIVVGFLASVAAVIFGWVLSGDINLKHALLLCASSIVTAFGASFILGLVMVVVIIVSRHFHINPDNVATPIAASLGDLTTLACLSWLASVFYHTMDTHPYLTSSSIVIGLLMVPLWAWLASQNEFVNKVLFSGWSPVVTAMIISSVGGLILDFTVSQFKGVAVFQLVINGVGGNLVAVQASRISTELHSIAQPGYLPPHMQVCLSPCSAFCDKKETSHAGTAQMLMLMVIPGHLIFSYTISYLEAGHTSFTVIFMTIYLAAALLQVFLLLYIAQIMTLNMWKLGIDPDNSAIPYLTAIGDLLGTMLLALAFHLLFLIGDRDSDVGD
ncbi:solute carrier family 41 member 1-like [Diabrotica virgifera virgifera]|uniref:Solute carrier family 41 member 1-like n=1 Tax=Diabrotica virgifera virgifera TaxID=50390 RepID=A0A6P7H4X0_DIAVI|nr:solute carrier family 41 member 1-like [Diabrotica virgifera virgifera]XP_050519531.1 solute carrier family 41 member 1-like [Diabrotica virgifera virgifera]XP_050519532.1 solute carrier family 41 member 1-like [Diabrotica virgifera virgifera]